MTSFLWAKATAADQQEVFGLMQRFYAEEHLAFSDERAGAALRALFAEPASGQIFLLRNGGGEAKGYLVLTRGFSLEFGGRFVLLDEVYLEPAIRGQGWGRQSLACAEAWAREQGVRALRLEVQHTNARARAFYAEAGFVDDRRDLLTRWL